MSVPDAFPDLAEELRIEHDRRVIALRGLALMKLDANQPRVRGVRVFQVQSPNRIWEVRDSKLKYASGLVSRVAEALAPGQ